MSLTVPFRPSDIPAGLQGFWKKDEGSGSRVDSSGNGNTLTDNNTVGATAENYFDLSGDGSADFEAGNSEFLSITDVSQVGLDLAASDFTFATWVKLETVTGDKPLFAKGASGAGYKVIISSTTLQVFIQSASFVLELVGVFSVGKWTHVAVTFNNASNLITFYIDGKVVKTGTTANTITDNSADFFIGRSFTGSDFMDGFMKDAAVWNVVLTPLQIKSLVLGTDLSADVFRAEDISTAPEVNWKLNEVVVTSGNRADSSGNGHTLTDVGGVPTKEGYIEGAGADFDGATDKFSFATGAGFDLTGGVWSFGGWFKFDDIGGTKDLFSLVIDATNYLKLRMIAGPIIQLEVVDGGGSTVSVNSLSGVIRAGAWYHIFFTENGNTWKIFVDGIDVTDTGGTDTSRAEAYTATSFLGADQSGGASFNGRMSDIAFWPTTALTDAEVVSLATGLSIQQSGVVSYYKVDEASGTRVDALGPNDLTDNNTVLFAAGKVDSAADFEADNSENLSILDASQIGLDLPKGFTLMCWVKPETLSAGLEILIGKDEQALGYGLGQANNKVNLIIKNANTNSVSSMTAGVFTHACGVFDGAVRHSYFDAVDETQVTSPTAPDDNSVIFRLGINKGAGGNIYDGLMDEILIATRYFRDEEVKAAYNKGLNGKEITSSEGPPPAPGAPIANRGLFLAYPV